MPTYNRRRFVPLAIHYFLRQDYPNRELIVVDDGTDRVDDLMPDKPNVRYIRIDQKLSVGTKRNRAIEAARGELIAHWDDDDWSAPNRLRLQVDSLLTTGAGLCGLDKPVFYDPCQECVWQYRYSGRRPWVAGGTWLYRRALWEDRPFPEVNDGEDTRFVWRLPRGQVLALGDQDWFVALLHPDNSSRKRLNTSRWRQKPLEMITKRMADDIAFYTDKQALPNAPSPASKKEVTHPRVTVAIPTFGPPTYLRRAVESILNQTYTNLRVVVVNDGGDPPWHVLEGIDDPRLVRFDLKANHGCYFADAVVLEATSDEFFVGQDADDWSEPERVELLMNRLRAEEADVVYAAIYNCSEEDPEHRWVDSFPSLNQELGAEFLHRAHQQVALYRSEALKSVGGPFAGFRIGYDSLLVNLLRMTCRIAFEPRPLMTYFIHSGSLTQDSKTGFGSPERDRVRVELERRYQESRTLYNQHRAGAIRRDTLAELIRLRAVNATDSRELATLREEAHRLRRLLSDPDTGTVVEDRTAHDPGGLVDDARLPWSESSVSKELARELSAHLRQNKPGRVLQVGSSVSTVLLADYAAGHNATITTLEHDPVCFQRTADLLHEFCLRQQVDLRYGPLADFEGRQWYDSRLQDDYDFVFADGPPAGVGRTAILPAIHRHLAEQWTLWLTDGEHTHERKCVAAWAKELQFRRRLWDVDACGVWVLKDPAPDAAVQVESGPKVSCLMPTHDRQQFVPQAVAYFLRQDYPNRELILVDDGEPVRDLIPDDPRVIYVRLRDRTSTGAKRNLAAEIAQGEVLVCWDDDDWFGPGRLSAQVGPILRGEAAITALGRSPFYCVPTGQFWRCTQRVHARMFFKQVIGGTIAFRRAARPRFPDSSEAEDAAFLKTLLRAGERLVPVPNRDLFVYVRHEANTWRFQEGRVFDRRGWHTVAAPHFMPKEDLEFYRQLRQSASGLARRTHTQA